MSPVVDRIIKAISNANGISASRLIVFTCLLIALVYGGLVYHFVWFEDGEPRFERIIKSDGLGYYRYLPDIFLTGEIDSLPKDALHFAHVKGKNVNKYYVGTAISIFPFFIGAVAWESLTQSIGDGRAPPYQIAVSLAALFYFVAGLMLLGRVMHLKGFEIKWVLISLVVISLGTNLLTYTVELPSMSHVYSWFWVNAFIFVFTRHSRNHSWSNVLLLGISLAMIILIRPVNGLIVLALPFYAGSKEQLINTIQDILKSKWLIPAIVLGAFILSFQCIVWYLQSGSFWIWSYQSEGFNFSNPQILEVLFGFRKGWFIYTPIAFLSLFGFYFLYKKSQYQFYTGIMFFLAIIYVISSWWNWYYGSSFSQRPFIEYYGFIALLLVLAWTSISKSWFLKLHLALCMACILLNGMQAYQYRFEILSKTDMNFEKYVYSLFKMDKKYAHTIGGVLEAIPYKPNFELEHSAFIDQQLAAKKNLNLDLTNTEYGIIYDIHLTPEMITERGYYLKLKMKRKEKEQNACQDALLVVEYKTQNNDTYGQQYFVFNDHPRKEFNKWKQLEFGVTMTPPERSTDFIRFFIWNKRKGAIQIDDYGIELFSVN